jgi:pyruvate/2-oxoglutarate dehydrogenase complex dihydrolipoamide acyltransferase (E2) component
VIEIRAPSDVFQDVDEGVEGLLEGWLVSEGDVVRAGQPLADAIVVKTSFQIVAPADGRIGTILVGEGETFGPGSELATLQEEEATVTAPAAAVAGAEAERVPLTGMRGAVAREMAGAWRHPRVAMAVEVDMTAVLAQRDALQEEAGDEPHLSPTHLVLRSLALELREHPRLNARIDEEAVELAGDINLGLAVNLDEGVIVPVIRHADRKSVPELAREAGELAAAARAGTLPGTALRDGTFTVSTLGAMGIDWFTPILNAPQVGILGVGAVAERVVARAGDAVVAPTMVLTLVFDHRAVDGHGAALLLAAVRDRLQRGEL